jgi:ANTAR domain
MDWEVLLRIIERFVSDQDSQDAAVGLVLACVQLLGVTGAGIMLMVNGQHRGTLAASDDAILAVEALQFSLDDGPCFETYRTGRPVSEPQLARPEIARWPGFAGPAVEAGVQAIFAFPLQIGAIQIGALDVYSDRPGDLGAQQVGDALNVAAVVTHAVLELQAGSPPGVFASELLVKSNQAVVHQASGMMSVQLGVSIGEAMIRLRSYARDREQPINDIARDVVDGSLAIG